MSIRQRTTKLLARRHDLNYFKRMSPLRAWQWYLAAGALLVAVLWFSGSQFAHGDAAFSAGPVSSSHAVFGQQCELCHVPVLKATRFTPAFGRRNHVPDSACLSCHNVGGHFATASTANPTCGSCHTEHIGSTHLAATADHTCTACHADLEARAGYTLRVAARIHNFAQDHPDFRPLRTASTEEKNAAFALKFNHADHMKAGLSGPGGNVTLACQSCHQTTLDANGRQSYTLAPVSYEKSCIQCHGLDFDKHVTQQAPHDYPQVVQTFVTRQITTSAQTHPDVVSAEIRNWPAQPPLPGQIKLPPPHSQQEWVANRIATAEILLWRGKCALCHRDLNSASLRVDGASPTLQPAGETSDAIPTIPLHQPAPAVASLVPIALPQIEPTQQVEHFFRVRRLQPSRPPGRRLHRVPRRRAHQRQRPRSPDAHQGGLPALPQRPIQPAGSAAQGWPRRKRLLSLPRLPRRTRRHPQRRRHRQSTHRAKVVLPAPSPRRASGRLTRRAHPSRSEPPARRKANVSLRLENHALTLTLRHGPRCF